MERLKSMKETLMSCVQGQMGNLANTDTKELGEAIDMIKDLSEAIYYCQIVKAMEEQEKEGKESRHKEHHYYTEKYYHYPLDMDERYEYRDMDRGMGRMYYQGRDSQGRFTAGRGGRNGYSDGSTGMGGRGNSGHSGGSHGYEEHEYPTEMRDYREGSSPVHRKYYMEAKEMHRDKKAQIEELEKYMKELSKDITEMIQDASPEETMLLKQKLSTLAEKIK